MHLLQVLYIHMANMVFDYFDQFNWFKRQFFYSTELLVILVLNP